MSSMRRTTVFLLALLLLAACGKSDDSGPTTTAATGRYVPPPATTTTTIDAACFIRGLSQGLTLAAIQQQCRLEAEWDALLADIAAHVRLRQRVADAFNAIRPGFMTPKDVVDWEQRSCTEGAQVVNELVGRARPTPAQQISLLSPLLDFASDAGGQCSTRPALRDDLAAVAWRTAAGPSPTLVSAQSVLRDQSSAPDLMRELFAQAHGGCDVFANGVVIGLKTWSNANPPKWAELALGTLVGALCEGAVDKLR